MKQTINTFIVLTYIALCASCGDGSSAVQTVSNTITTEPIVGKWYPYESWLDDNNNNQQESGEWHAFDKAYQQQLAQVHMTIEDLSMTYLANGKGYVTALQSDSSAFIWQANGANKYTSTVVEDGKKETMQLSLNNGVLTSTAIGLEKEIHWSKNVPK
jgi:hypothetical protein